LVVREFVSREENGETISAFSMLRTVVLKTTPTSMAWDAEQDGVLLVSTIDRQVHKYDVRNGQHISSFRATDSEGGDAVILSSLAHIARPYGAPIIAGVSSTDKSIRIYDESGTLVARDWGHTEGVTDIALVNAHESEEAGSGQKSLVTVAVDGTIFVWNLELRPHRQDMSKSMDLASPSTPTTQELLANKPPLRRILSQSELARFQRSPDEDTDSKPTGNRSPKLKKKLSKFSLAHSPKLDPSPIPTIPKEFRPGSGAGTAKRAYRHRSPSPPSPRNPQIAKRRSSFDVRVRTKASVPEFGSMGASTESLCRTLRAYRKRLANSTETMNADMIKDVERELAITARAVGEKAQSKGVDEEVIVKLLDQYSERLVSLLDEKIAHTVALRLRENSESGVSMGLASPVIERGVEIKAEGVGKEKEKEKEEKVYSSTEGTTASDVDDVVAATEGLRIDDASSTLSNEDSVTNQTPLLQVRKPSSDRES
jgi:hypothetical protein